MPGLYEFLRHRKWFVGKDGLVAEEEYALLKEGKLQLSQERQTYLRGFMDGWKRAKS